MKNALLLLFTLATLLSACAPVAGVAAPVAQVAQSNKPRLNPGATLDDVSEAARGNNEFAFDLYRQLRGQDSNLFYSPYSITLALAMTYAGARGETAEEMAATLRYTLDQSRLHPAFNALDQALTSRGANAEGKDGEPFRLHIANALWGQQGFEFLPAFLDLLAENYGAGMRLVDFVKDAESARVTINDWVAEQTEDRIKDLIPPGAVDSLTRLVLTNAIYFNAAWAHRFEKQATIDGAFHLLDGSTVTVPLMREDMGVPYLAGDGFQAIELPYDGGELSMIILLPQEGKFAAFEESLDAEIVHDAIARMERQQVRLTLPRWKFESEMRLGDVLAAMGMPTAFTPDADFSGMDGKRDLFIGEVLHKAFVDVNEDGTEAAAATAVVMRVTSAPADPVSVTVDRPFVFLIRDIQTGAVLFVGRVLNPAA